MNTYYKNPTQFMVKLFPATLNEIFQISNLTIKINFLSIHIKPNGKNKKAPIP